MSAPTRVIRFVAKEDLKTYYGQPIQQGDLGLLYHEGAPLSAHILSGSPLDPETTVTSATKSVSRLLYPLDAAEIGTIRGMGAQYAADKSKAVKPEVPVLFYKPLTTLSGPEDPIFLPPLAKNGGQSDYECELCVVIGKKAKDVSVDKALSYVAYYCATNDVSARGLCAKGLQWGVGKSFDSWNPLGPVLVAANAIKNPDNLALTTTVNGELKQKSNTSQMTLSVAEIISACSQGVTLEVGSLILTGSPLPLAEVRSADSDPWLKHGDDVRVWVEELGTLINPVIETSRPMNSFAKL